MNKLQENYEISIQKRERKKNNKLLTQNISTPPFVFHRVARSLRGYPT